MPKIPASEIGKSSYTISNFTLNCLSLVKISTNTVPMVKIVVALIPLI